MDTCAKEHITGNDTFPRVNVTHTIQDGIEELRRSLRRRVQEGKETTKEAPHGSKPKPLGLGIWTYVVWPFDVFVPKCSHIVLAQRGQLLDWTGAAWV